MILVVQQLHTLFVDVIDKREVIIKHSVDMNIILSIGLCIFYISTDITKPISQKLYDSCIICTADHKLLNDHF